MPTSSWKEGDTARALAFWAEYQKLHDVSERKGQAVGIEPESGRVWFGKDLLDIKQQMLAEGVDRPFFGTRVGYESYGRKGGHR